ISRNGQLGIDLGADGVTPNDACDMDTGPNQLENFPDISRAVALPNGTIRLKGSLVNPADSTVTLDFYLNSAPDSSGFGRGEQYIGSSVVTLHHSCKVPLNISLQAAVAPGQWITATATDSAGNTSEFSQALQVTQTVIAVPIDAAPEATETIVGIEIGCG